ncbi:hypothetical protein SAMN05444266_107214 [Chitinophaga jiangningensis]|uniref:Uncharacterized protein n=1 Tax=Chitinophaga jiangningensis TaxID=1419482 RepID=A0A1M7HFA5_9BACT|nr:hypothetical protein [Chitinophaga jiangningensis]SHM27149.1 hypothetical protein SAMN05444266_107214 [Chitinophaga jiangningensis]
MAHKSLHFSIPSPCSKSWDEMEISGEGRYCDSCCKTVVDFTQLTDEQIITLISKHTGRLCGHFNVSQLNRNLLPMQPQYRLVPVILLSAGMLLVHGAASAQQVKTKDTTVAPVKPAVSIPVDSAVAPVPATCASTITREQDQSCEARQLTGDVVITYYGRRRIRIFGWNTHIPAPRVPAWLRRS